MSMIAIDRIEADRAILDIHGEIVEVPLAALPPGVQEGDLLSFTAAQRDDCATATNRATVELVEQLRATDPGDMDIDI